MWHWLDIFRINRNLWMLPQIKNVFKFILNNCLNSSWIIIEFYSLFTVTLSLLMCWQKVSVTNVTLGSRLNCSIKLLTDDWRFSIEQQIDLKLITRVIYLCFLPNISGCNGCKKSMLPVVGRLGCNCDPKSPELNSFENELQKLNNHHELTRIVRDWCW